MADQHIFSVQTKRTSLNSPSVLCNFIWGMGVRGDGWGARFSGTLASAGRDAAGPPTLRVSCILFPSVGEEADEPSLLVLTGVTREAGGCQATGCDLSCLLPSFPLLCGDPGPDVNPLMSIGV